jgi:hypothetical protein
VSVSCVVVDVWAYSTIIVGVVFVVTVLVTASFVVLAKDGTSKYHE